MTRTTLSKERETTLNDVGTGEARVPVSVVVLTKNEERNLGAFLENVTGWCSEIFVVDSGSDDATVPLAMEYGAKVLTHPFESHTRQWNWAFANVPFQCDWALCLDADQRLEPSLRDEIAQLFGDGTTNERPIPHSGFYIKRRQIFRGKWIKHGGYYPKYLLKLVRHREARCDENELLDSRFYVKGTTSKLQNDLIEDNQNESDISFWIEKHNKYAVAQAKEELRRRGGIKWSIQPKFWGTPDQRTLFLRDIWYQHFPLYLRPFLLFSYRYLLRLGFLDGKEGLVFHLFQSLWFRMLVDAKIDELRDAPEPVAETIAAQPD
jgi:glycosyltransferase involved in cell wall biosynthesis